MKDAATYAWRLVWNWWGVVGVLSVAAFFLPWLGAYWWFIAAVAVVAFAVAGYAVYHDETTRHAAKLDESRAALKQAMESFEQQLTTERREHQEREDALNREIGELRRSKFTAETQRIAEDQYRPLGREQKVAIRHLLVVGDMTEQQALHLLQSKGMAMNWGAVLGPLAQATSLVQRVLQDRQRGEHATGYTGNYTINRTFRDVLEEIVTADPESEA